MIFGVNVKLIILEYFGSINGIKAGHIKDEPSVWGKITNLIFDIQRFYPLERKGRRERETQKMEKVSGRLLKVVRCTS